MTYSDILVDHARNLRNVGLIEDADGLGRLGDPSCDDFVRMTVRVRDGYVMAVRFMAKGCSAAIAACSMATELVRGRTLREAAWLTDADVAVALDGMPEEKLHCADLAATALQNALMDYSDRHDVDLHDWQSLFRIS
jgi:nitrogen fixation protein NifU and related proteins